MSCRTTRAAAAVAASILAGGCAVTPENVCGRGEVEILERVDWYRGMDSLPVRTFTGTLGLAPPAPAAGGRAYAFTLDGVNVFVTGTRLVDLMQKWVGRRVVIRGRTTNVGSGPEIWPGTISCLDEEAQG